METIKAAGYLRVSTLAQAEGESLRIQRTEIERRAAYEGWELVAIYDEGAGWSGGNGNRPEMTRCIADAMAGEHRVIITLDMMRGFRNLRDCLNTLHMLDKHKLRLVTIKDKLDSSDPLQRAILLPVMAGVAQWEKDKIKERMQAGKSARLHSPNGPTMFLGTPPFAHSWNKEAHRLELDPVKAEVYKRIVAMYLTEGLSIAAIAARLKAEGVVNVRKPHSSPTISRMLKAEVYHTGIYVANRYYYKKDGKYTRRTSKKKADPVAYETEPIIDKDTWDAIQAKLKASKTRTRWASDIHNYWLRDALKCGHCGMAVKPKRNRNKLKSGKVNVHHYYTCTCKTASDNKLDELGRERCKLPHIKQADIEQQVWHSITMGYMLNDKELMSPAVKDNSATYMQQAEKWAQAVDSHKRELGTLETQRAKLYELTKQEGADVAEINRQLIANKKAQATATQRMQEATKKHKAAVEAAADNSAVQRLLKDEHSVLFELGQQLATLGPADKKMVVEAMLGGAKMEVHSWEAAEGGQRAWQVQTGKLKLKMDVIKQLMEAG